MLVKVFDELFTVHYLHAEGGSDAANFRPVFRTAGTRVFTGDQPFKWKSD
jgi:hypothetical protein